MFFCEFCEIFNNKYNTSCACFFSVWPQIPSSENKALPKNFKTFPEIHLWRILILFLPDFSKNSFVFYIEKS